MTRARKYWQIAAAYARSFASGFRDGFLRQVPVRPSAIVIPFPADRVHRRAR